MMFKPLCNILIVYAILNSGGALRHGRIRRQLLPNNSSISLVQQEQCATREEVQAELESQLQSQLESQKQAIIRDVQTRLQSERQSIFRDVRAEIQSERQTIINDVRAEIRSLAAEIQQDIQSVVDNCTAATPSTPTTSIPTDICDGTPGWRRVVYIDMTDTSTACPQGLKLTTYSKRTCGRANTKPGCSSTTFSVEGSQYSRVCGRIKGYQYRTTGAFYAFLTQGQRTIDGYYVDGVSLTHGATGSRQHIWTFAAGLTETDTNFPSHTCPCDTSNTATVAPHFVRNDYFCESGIHGQWNYGTKLFQDDLLWDGQNCTTTSTCCQFNNPPWFTKTLPNSTTDDIELRICNNNAIISDNVPLELIELYIQ